MTSRRSAVAQAALLAGAIPLALAGCTPADAAPRATARAVSGDKPLGIVSVTAAGAKGDGTTDDTAPVLAAIKTVADRDPGDAKSGAGVVYFPTGVYTVSKPISVPQNITLVGETPMGSKLVYTGGDAEVFLTIGRPGEIAVYSGVKDLQVDGGGKADTTLRLYGPQEGSTVSGSMVVGARKVGVEVISDGIVGGSNKFTIERSWIWTSGDQGLAGVRIAGGGGPLAIRDTTFVGTNRSADPPAGSAGVLALGSIVALDDVNVEHFESHTHLDRTHADIRNATGFFNTYGVRTTPASKNTTVYLTNGLFDKAKASILDEGAGVTIALAQSYWSEAYKFDQRHFQRNLWNVGGTNIWRSPDQQAVLGYDTPAGGDGAAFAMAMRAGGSWQRVADVVGGVFGAAESSFDGAHLRLGDHHLWVDAQGVLRMKRGAPTSDGDGQAVGS